MVERHSSLTFVEKGNPVEKKADDLPEDFEDLLDRLCSNIEKIDSKNRYEKDDKIAQVLLKEAV